MLSVTPSRSEGQTALESNINARVGERQRALFSLEGQVAIVTGGTGALGSAMAHGLADVGAAVGVMGRRTDRAREIAQQIRDNGGEAVELPAAVVMAASPTVRSISQRSRSWATSRRRKVTGVPLLNGDTWVRRPGGEVG